MKQYVIPPQSKTVHYQITEEIREILKGARFFTLSTKSDMHSKNTVSISS